MEIIVVIIISALAVWYLYRRFRIMYKGDQSSCGCSGCDSCAAAPKTTRRADQADEKDR
jgi:hypothetical protein